MSTATVERPHALRELTGVPVLTPDQSGWDPPWERIRDRDAACLTAFARASADPQ